MSGVAYVYEHDGSPVEESVYLDLCKRAWKATEGRVIPADYDGITPEYYLRCAAFGAGEEEARALASAIWEPCRVDMYADHERGKVYGYVFGSCYEEEQLPTVKVITA